MSAIIDAIESFTFRATEWQFVDLRIDIPPRSFGSDAINLHTQYSNPVAIAAGERPGIGCSFTLGAGNNMMCEAMASIVAELDGRTVGDLIQSERGFYDSFANPSQLRWLSPNAGVPLMAAGAIVNTVLDAAGKSTDLAAWELLARLPSQYLLELLPLRALPSTVSAASLRRRLDAGLVTIDDRVAELKQTGLPVYFTTWIGHDADQIAEQMLAQREERGISRFKLKISPRISDDGKKLERVRALLPDDVWLAVDANQTLSPPEAQDWLSLLSSAGFVWLEEPFAPDNVALFADLVGFKQDTGLGCEVVTGENCPNAHTAAALMASGIDRFQADPCRMLGLIDAVAVTLIAAEMGTAVTPHAGGSALDELSPHIQLFNLARVRPDLDPHASLTENVGFSSKFFQNPTVVKDGYAATPTAPGLLVGLADAARSKVKDYREGPAWLKL